MRWIAVSLVAGGIVAALPAQAQEWTRFRGPNGTGISAAKGIPVQFTEADFNWKVKLPGAGHSSPVIWGDKVFITSAEEDQGKQHLLCLQASDGKQLWSVTRTFDKYNRHKFNSYASATAAVDKDLVYVPWYTPAMASLIAYTHDGKEVWKRDLGQWHGQHGGAASPILFENLVIIRQDCDDMGPESFVLAMDRKTGQEKWRCPRISKTASYSTPVLFKGKDGASQLVFNSNAHGFTGVDPRTGKVLWEVPNLFQQRCVSTPAIAGDAVIGTAGNGGGARQGVAVRPDAAKAKAADVVAYQLDRRVTPYVPTPLVYGEHVFLWGDGGILSCVKAANGETVWSERVGGNYFSSPVCIDGKLYGVNSAGEVVVVEAGPQFKLLGRSPLGDPCHSTPAVSGGALYVHTEGHLISIGGKKKVAQNP